MAVSALVVSVGIGASSSLALFTDTTDAAGADLGTKAIFPGERVTPAFSVRDASGGAAPVDRSSELGFSGDGRTLTSSPWSSAFSSGRYLDFDLNASLPAGLAALTARFRAAIRQRGRRLDRLLLPRGPTGLDGRAARYVWQQRQPPRLRHRDEPDAEHHRHRHDRHLHRRPERPAHPRPGCGLGLDRDGHRPSHGERLHCPRELHALPRPFHGRGRWHTAHLGVGAGRPLMHRSPEHRARGVGRADDVSDRRHARTPWTWHRSIGSMRFRRVRAAPDAARVGDPDHAHPGRLGPGTGCRQQHGPRCGPDAGTGRADRLRPTTTGATSTSTRRRHRDRPRTHRPTGGVGRDDQVHAPRRAPGPDRIRTALAAPRRGRPCRRG